MAATNKKDDKKSAPVKKADPKDKKK